MIQKELVVRENHDEVGELMRIVIALSLNGEDASEWERRWIMIANEEAYREASSCVDLTYVKMKHIKSPPDSEAEHIWEKRWLDIVEKQATACEEIDEARDMCQKTYHKDPAEKIWMKRFTELADEEALRDAPSCTDPNTAWRKRESSPPYSMAHKIWRKRYRAIKSR